MLTLWITVRANKKTDGFGEEFADSAGAVVSAIVSHSATDTKLATVHAKSAVIF